MSKKEIKRVTPALILGILAVYLVLSTVFQGASHPDLIPLFNIVLVAGLVAVTSFYAYMTLKMAEATEKQAEASMKMAKEMREQRYDTLRPVIDIQRESTDSTRALGEAASTKEELVSSGLSCVIHNIGIGPAIDVYSCVQNPSGQRQCHDFGILAKEARTSKMNLSLEKQDTRMVLATYYKDVYGRKFESSREVILDSEERLKDLGPLKIRQIEEDR